MEYAFFKDQKILAFDIAENYIIEKEIRKASKNGELLCPDSECKYPILRYCHGDKKIPYFAHRKNGECDYAIYDEENNYDIKSALKTLYEYFNSKGYDVDLEVKILAHHYTHLLFKDKDGTLVPVELGTNKTSVDFVDRITNEYRENNLDVRWIVIGDNNFESKESKVCFFKRYLLNESANNEFIIINRECSEVIQCRRDDPNKYQYKGELISSKNYPEFYKETSSFENLEFEQNNFAINGFNDRYNEWLRKKTNAFNKKIKKLKEEEIESLEESSWFDGTKDIIICELCGKVASADEFSVYGGFGKAKFLGKCRECMRLHQNLKT